MGERKKDADASNREAQHSSSFSSAPSKGPLLQTTWEFWLAEPSFSLVMSGRQTIDARPCTGPTANASRFAGATVQYKHGPQKFRALVVAVQEYSSFRELVEKEGLKAVAPTAADVQAAVVELRKHHAPQAELERGVVALRLRVLDEFEVNPLPRAVVSPGLAVAPGLRKSSPRLGSLS